MASVGRGLAAFGVVGGAIQTVVGVRELQNGDTGNGAVDVSGGVLNTGGCIAALAGGTAATVGAPIALGVAAIMDGGRDIVNSVHSDSDGTVQVDGEHMVEGALKGMGGMLMAASPALAATGIGAPAAAAIGLAGGVLYGVTNLVEHRDDIAHFFGI